MNHILSIDCGTTSTRAIIFDQHYQLVHIEQQDLPIHHPQSDWVEQSPNDIWSLTQSCLTKALETINPASVNAIGITNQRETSIIWDKETGQAIGPAISWQCRRTTDTCQQLSSYAKTIRNKTGLPLDPYFSATKFNWLLNHYSEAASKLTSNQLCFGTVDTWLLWHLTNGKSYATDVTNASRSMLFNIQSLTYDDELCSIFNIPKQALPHVFPSTHSFGTYSFNGIDIPIKGIIGDQQAALFAQCGRSKGTIKNTYGTGLFLMGNTGFESVQSNHLVSTIAIGIDNTIDYAIEGSVFTGGSLIQWLRDQLGLISTASESESIAHATPSSDGVVIVPALTGLGAPYWKPDATGSIFGLTRSTTKDHIIRAALESIALQTNDIIDTLRSECPSISVDTMRVDGGAAENQWLMQCQADVSQVTIERPASTEATALGAALCAAHQLSDWDDYTPNVTATFSPNHNHQLDDLKTNWQTAINHYQ